MTKLGKQLENPYSVENMLRAYENLKESGEITEELEITASHLYLKFKPKDEKEFGLLKSDTTLELYAYPLDYEILEGGNFYHDPSLPITQPTYQYCAVSVDKILPTSIEYEILAELFIPEELATNSNGRLSHFSHTEELVEEALFITGNLEKKKNKGERRSTWRPSGNIRHWDTNVGRFVGVEGVEVRATRWFTTHKGTTNAVGFYTCDGTFKNPANYSLKWERYDFSIRSGSIGQATFNGPKIERAWDLNVRGDAQAFYATIFRAAYRYYYGNILNLRRPPQNGNFKPQMTIGAYDEQGPGLGNHNAGRRHFSTSVWIKVWSRSNNIARTSEQIYATTIHELAHASHWNMNGSVYNNTELKVKESWARGVEWALTRSVYPNYRGGQTRPPEYTQVVVDMIDTRADDFTNWGLTFPQGDDVTGYTIRQVEDAVNGINSWNAWRLNIFLRYENATRDNLEALFNFWN